MDDDKDSLLASQPGPRAPAGVWWALAGALCAVVVCGAALGVRGLRGWDPDVRAVRAMMEAQTAAWNDGDLAAFVSFYRDSDATVYASPDAAFVGLAAILARYEAAYPDAAAMGHLHFSDESYFRLGADAMGATGTYHVLREGAADELTGQYLLALRNEPAGWRIVCDYTAG